MLTQPMDVLKEFPIRKSKKQKLAFRVSVQDYVKTLGYESYTEAGSFGAQNLIIGDPNKARYLVTAHYDTCARMPFPNLITPCSFFPFLLYQLFTVIVMFAFVAIPAVPTYFLTEDKNITFFVAYVALLGFLALMMLGPANKNNANDNTSGVVAVLEIAKALPLNQRDKVCFILFDLDEAGLLGSSGYRSKHKKVSDKQIVLNLDCVGDGDEIVFFLTSKLRKSVDGLEKLRQCAGPIGKKSIAIHEKGFSYYPSDQANFPLGVGIAALNRSKWAGLYLSRIHTYKDTILDETNINILRAALITLISNDAS